MSSVRFAVHFRHPLINHDERDSDPHATLELAYAAAITKAQQMVVDSVNKIKILNVDKQADGVCITLAYANGTPTGAFIEVRPVQKRQAVRQANFGENYAGVVLNE